MVSLEAGLNLTRKPPGLVVTLLAGRRLTLALQVTREFVGEEQHKVHHTFSNRLIIFRAFLELRM